MDRLRVGRLARIIGSLFSRGVNSIPVRRCSTFTIIDKNGSHFISESLGAVWGSCFDLLSMCWFRFRPRSYVPISSVGLGRSRESIKVVRRRRGLAFFPKAAVQETSGAVAGPRRVCEVFI